MNVPFLDLVTHNNSFLDEIRPAIDEVIATNAFAGGKYVAQFEQEFAEFCGAQYAVGLGSGTDALWLAMKALDIGSGDEVITVSSTFIATVEAITLTGATPVFVDIDPATYTMDPALVEQAVTEKTKAIVPVHLFGQVADMDLLLEIAKKHNLSIVEDAAQVHGGFYKNRPAGTLGEAGCFSFYPGKNLGAFGDAGAVTTNRQDLYEQMCIFRDHGQRKKYDHVLNGWNARMDGIQGAVLSVKLKRLRDTTEKRQANAKIYDARLKNMEGLVAPVQADYAKHVYHIYAIRTKNRDAVMQALNEKGIGCGIHYPVPVHRQTAFEYLGYGEGSLPVTEQCANEFISLPMFPELQKDQIEYVCDSLEEILKTGVANQEAVAT